MSWKISIIIPIHNSELYLKKCLHSLKVQTYPNIEVIMVNDGSNDGSEDVCLSFSEEDKRFVYIYKDNEGVSAARNTGLDLMTGAYFSFVDSDDWVEPEYCEKLLNVAVIDNADMVFCGINNIINGEKQPQDESAGIIDVILNRRIEHFIVGHPQYICGPVWRVLYRKEKVEDFRFDKALHAGEDTPFLLECIEKADKISFVNECLYNYNVPQIEYYKKYYSENIIEEGYILGCKMHTILQRCGCLEWAEAELFRRYCVIVDWICSSKKNKKQLFQKFKCHEGFPVFNTNESYRLYKKLYRRNRIKIFLIHKKWFALYDLLFTISRAIRKR